MIVAGQSDKYGVVMVERVGNTGFRDVSEQVALFRAQDRHALVALRAYREALRADDGVPAGQLASVERQIEAFERWQAAHPERVRTPGTQDER